MYRYIVIIFLTLFTLHSANEKFDEDKYIMLSIMSKESGDDKSAKELFLKLYKETKKFEYLKEAIKIDIISDNIKDALELLDGLKIETLPLDFQKIAISVYAKNGDYETAQKIAFKLLEKQKSEDVYELIATIYLIQKDYHKALTYLESAYSINYKESFIDAITTILLNNLNEPEKAISYIETHIRMFGCAKSLCNKLNIYYLNKKDYDSLIRVFKHLYEEYKSSEYSKAIVDIYLYKNDYKGAIDFLISTDSDNELLLELYRYQAEYTKVIELLQRLFKESGDYNFLAREAIYEYESAKDKSDLKMLNRVVNNLTLALQHIDSDIYNNFLGYILIDHDIDIKKGINYVNRALIIQPNSEYYLDSLAWGYYKDKNCKEAYKIMDRIIKDINEPEILYHYKMIKECYDEEILKGKKK